MFTKELKAEHPDKYFSRVGTCVKIFKEMLSGFNMTVNELQSDVRDTLLRVERQLSKNLESIPDGEEEEEEEALEEEAEEQQQVLGSVPREFPS